MKKLFTARFASISAMLVLLCGLASAQNATFDMLDWMTMDPFGSHMTGPGTPMWSVMDANHGKFYWVKSAQGYPWDVKTYDANLIYDWVTEVSWSDPRNFKRQQRYGIPANSAVRAIHGWGKCQIAIPNQDSEFKHQL